MIKKTVYKRNTNSSGQSFYNVSLVIGPKVYTLDLFTDGCLDSGCRALDRLPPAG